MNRDARPSLSGQLVLSLFPGADLFSRPFEDLGACVVRGPEKMLAQRIEDFRGLPGRFDGIVGGPPCQKFSTANHSKSKTDTYDGFPDFLRCVAECRPRWWVAENVRGALRHALLPPSGAVPVKARDWDCGGLTKRERWFFFWPPELGVAAIASRPIARPGYTSAEYTVTASCGRRGASPTFGGRHHILKAPGAAALQGFPGMDRELSHRPDRTFSNDIRVHLLGNGVPRAMGAWVADVVARWLKEQGTP